MVFKSYLKQLKILNLKFLEYPLNFKYTRIRTFLASKSIDNSIFGETTYQYSFVELSFIIIITITLLIRAIA